MRLKNLHLKLKGIRLTRLLIGKGRKKGRKSWSDEKRASWMMHVSHGYHVVDLDSSWDNGVLNEFDSIVVQREQIQKCELWFFGVFDDGIGEGVTKYMQSHFFNKIPKEPRLGKLGKEAMKKAHLYARAKFKDREKTDTVWKFGSASAMVINGEKLVIANMGDYRAVICRNGEAYQICKTKMHWPFKIIPGYLRAAKMHKITSGSNIVLESKMVKTSELTVESERIDSEIEFIILASTGVWEVMKQQEAVNLIRHIEDPKEAAECLANESLSRLSKSKISCLVIRFD